MAVSIYLEITPNPSTLKFVADRLITPLEGLELDKTQLSHHNSFLHTLFDFPFIERVYIRENYLSITKRNTVEWFEVQEKIRVLIKDYLQHKEWILELEDLITFEDGNKNVSGLNDNKQSFEKSPYDSEIINLLEEYIQPAVSLHGGEISFVGFRNNILFVRMQGACNGCPSSTVTLKDGVERLMHEMLPDIVKEVCSLT